jgi:hypothetical protein
VVELEAMRQRRLEIVVERGFEQMAPECRVALEPFVGEDLAHERFGRAVVLLADADAHGGQVADEEVDPMIRRDHHQQVGAAGRQPAPDFVEAGGQLAAMARGHRLPIARDDRAVARCENPDEVSHGRSLFVPSARAAAP